MFEDFIPPKPRLKTNSQNKEFLRSKIVPSRQINMEFDSSTVREIADSLYPVTKSELSNINEDDRFKRPNKKFKKTIKRALEKISGIDRQNNLYRSNSFFVIKQIKDSMTIKVSIKNILLPRF